MCRVISNLSGARVVAGALVEGSGEEDAEPGNAGGWMDLSIMMEEYLDGEVRFEPVHMSLCSVHQRSRVEFRAGGMSAHLTNCLTYAFLEQLQALVLHTRTECNNSPFESQMCNARE